MGGSRLLAPFQSVHFGAPAAPAAAGAACSATAGLSSNRASTANRTTKAVTTVAATTERMGGRVSEDRRRTQQLLCAIWRVQLRLCTPTRMAPPTRTIVKKARL